MPIDPDPDGADSSEEINPYAPTLLIDSKAEVPLGGQGAVIAKSRVLGRTIFAVACSGATFGGLFGLVTLVFGVLRRNNWQDSGVVALELTLIGVLGMLAGFLLAGLAAVFIVPSLMWLVGESEAFGGSNWDRRSIRLFAASNGVVCGWLSIVVMSGLQPFSLVVGLFPAAVGLIATPFFLRGLLREADQ